MSSKQHLTPSTLIGACAAALALCSTAAIAAPDQGLYIGADLGRSKNDISIPADVKPQPGSSKSATSLGLHVGYQFNRHFATELSVARLGKASIGDSSSKTTAYSLDALAKLPVSDQFSVYGRLGASHYERGFQGLANTGGQHSVGMHVGLGLDYAITLQWGLRAELSRHNNLPDGAGYGRSTDQWSMGVNYRF
ncbi:porin family protein [Paucibacter sp. APW11]|uniref:Porin family protein n=1 Tax=Roseateles aquae TaxID=3077235 RepID=A0ABU3P6H7_9BURK|nr:porin family protein [Paucibacter sp. APW11]MDT8998164.1 porin family protein [Paucibacter sp. APW11]